MCDGIAECLGSVVAQLGEDACIWPPALTREPLPRYTCSSPVDAVAVFNTLSVTGFH